MQDRKEFYNANRRIKRAELPDAVTKLKNAETTGYSAARRGLPINEKKLASKYKSKELQIKFRKGHNEGEAFLLETGGNSYYYLGHGHGAARRKNLQVKGIVISKILLISTY